MKFINKLNGNIKYLADDHPTSVAVSEGYEYSFDENNEIVVGGRTGINKEAIKLKIENGTITQQDILQVLKYILNKLD